MCDDEEMSLLAPNTYRIGKSLLKTSVDERVLEGGAVIVEMNALCDEDVVTEEILGAEEPNDIIIDSSGMVLDPETSPTETEKVVEREPAVIVLVEKIGDAIAQEYDYAREQNIRLIGLVKTNEMLYNSGSGRGSSQRQEVIRKLWNEVAETMELDARDCKTRWLNLRNDFRVKLNNYEITGKEYYKNWVYYKELEFLEPYIHQHRRLGKTPPKSLSLPKRNCGLPPKLQDYVSHDYMKQLEITEKEGSRAQQASAVAEDSSSSDDEDDGRLQSSSDSDDDSAELEETNAVTLNSSDSDSESEPDPPPQIKRKRGRPYKSPDVIQGQFKLKRSSVYSPGPGAPESGDGELLIKKKRGRPPKPKLEIDEGPKRKRGRPPRSTPKYLPIRPSLSNERVILVTVTDTNCLERVFSQRISYNDARRLNLEGFNIGKWGTGFEQQPADSTTPAKETETCVKEEHEEESVVVNGISNNRSMRVVSHRLAEEEIAGNFTGQSMDC